MTEPRRDPIAPLLKELEARIKRSIAAYNAMELRQPFGDPEHEMGAALLSLETMIPTLARFRHCDALIPGRSDQRRLVRRVKQGKCPIP